MADIYELTATSITSGLVIALGDVMPGITRYRETVPAQLLVYPHLFINQLTVDITPELRTRNVVRYLINIRYHVAADPASVVGSLQQQLDDASIKLLGELKYIKFGDELVRLTGCRTEKVDGVLHFFANITVYAKTPEVIDPVQETLGTSITTAAE